MLDLNARRRNKNSTFYHLNLDRPETPIAQIPHPMAVNNERGDQNQAQIQINPYNNLLSHINSYNNYGHIPLPDCTNKDKDRTIRAPLNCDHRYKDTEGDYWDYQKENVAPIQSQFTPTIHPNQNSSADKLSQNEISPSNSNSNNNGNNNNSDSSEEMSTQIKREIEKIYDTSKYLLYGGGKTLEYDDVALYSYNKNPNPNSNMKHRRNLPSSNGTGIGLKNSNTNEQHDSSISSSLPNKNQNSLQQNTNTCSNNNYCNHCPEDKNLNSDEQILHPNPGWTNNNTNLNPSTWYNPFPHPCPYETQSQNHKEQGNTMNSSKDSSTHEKHNFENDHQVQVNQNQRNNSTRTDSDVISQIPPRSQEVGDSYCKSVNSLLEYLGRHNGERENRRNRSLIDQVYINAAMDPQYQSSIQSLMNKYYGNSINSVMAKNYRDTDRYYSNCENYVKKSEKKLNQRQEEGDHGIGEYISSYSKNYIPTTRNKSVHYYEGETETDFNFAKTPNNNNHVNGIKNTRCQGGRHYGMENPLRKYRENELNGGKNRSSRCSLPTSTSTRTRHLHEINKKTDRAHPAPAPADADVQKYLMPFHTSETHASYRNPQEIVTKMKNRHQHAILKKGYKISDSSPPQNNNLNRSHTPRSGPRLTESQASYQNPYERRNLALVGSPDNSTLNYARCRLPTSLDTVIGNREPYKNSQGDVEITKGNTDDTVAVTVANQTKFHQNQNQNHEIETETDRRNPNRCTQPQAPLKERKESQILQVNYKNSQNNNNSNSNRGDGNNGRNFDLQSTFDDDFSVTSQFQLKPQCQCQCQSKSKQEISHDKNHKNESNNLYFKKLEDQQSHSPRISNHGDHFQGENNYQNQKYDTDGGMRYKSNSDVRPSCQSELNCNTHANPIHNNNITISSRCNSRLRHLPPRPRPPNKKMIRYASNSFEPLDDDEGEGDEHARLLRIKASKLDSYLTPSTRKTSKLTISSRASLAVKKSISSRAGSIRNHNISHSRSTSNNDIRETRLTGTLCTRTGLEITSKEGSNTMNNNNNNEFEGTVTQIKRPKFAVTKISPKPYIRNLLNYNTCREDEYGRYRGRRSRSGNNSSSAPGIQNGGCMVAPVPLKILLYCSKGILTVPSPTDVLPDCNSFSKHGELTTFQRNRDQCVVEDEGRYTCSVNMEGFLDDDIYLFMDNLKQKLFVEGRRPKRGDVNARQLIETIDLPHGLEPDNLRIARDYSGTLYFEEAWLF